MSLALPPFNSPIRDLFVIDDLVDWRAIPTFGTTLIKARRYVREQKQNGLREVFCIAMKADGSIVLFRVGPRGGWKKLWNFGVPI